MDTQKEKLSILSQMIDFARADGTIKKIELDFLVNVASLLGVDKATFTNILEQKTEHIAPKSQADRILQFHRLVLLMNVDQEQHEAETKKIHEMGLQMGLPPAAITQVLTVMHNYPNKVVPPDVLIDIFKIHYN